MGADRANAGAKLEVGEFVTHHITQLLIQWMKLTGNYSAHYTSSSQGTAGHQYLMGFIAKQSKHLTILTKYVIFVWHSPDHMSRTW